MVHQGTEHIEGEHNRRKFACC